MADLRTEFIDAPLWQKFLLASLGTFIVFYFVYNTLFKHIWADYHAARKKMGAIEYKLKTSQLLLNDLPILQKKGRALARKLPKYLLTEKTSTTLFNSIAKQSGLNLTSLKPQMTTALPYWKDQQYLMQLSGTLGQFHAFLSKLYASKLAFRINSIKINSFNNSKYNILLNMDLFTVPNKYYKKRKPRYQPRLKLQGFWNKAGQSKVFINNALYGIGDRVGSYRLIQISEKSKTAVVRSLRTNRKYTLKVLK